MSLRKAEKNEAQEILKFYKDVIKFIENTEFQPKWSEKYPNLDYIEKSIKKEELYICTIDNKIISSFILNNEFDNDYSNVTWKTDAETSEILVIHTFAISSNFRSKGLSAKILNEIKKIYPGAKTIQIDIIDGNTGAQKVFEKLGFEYVATIKINHPLVGIDNFHLYEKALK